MKSKLSGSTGRISAGAVVLAILVSGGAIWRTSSAAFNANTANSGNSWTAGQVAIQDDDTGTAMFTATGIKPGSTGFKCIEVTYTGDIASTVKLYATSPGGTGLGTYIDLVVAEGTSGTFADCTGFTGSNIYTGTLATFVSTYTNHGNGLGTFTPSTNGSKKVYKFTWTLQDNNSAKGLAVNCGFTWEAIA